MAKSLVSWTHKDRFERASERQRERERAAFRILLVDVPSVDPIAAVGGEKYTRKATGWREE